jgi:aspartate/glutamate racemase
LAVDALTALFEELGPDIALHHEIDEGLLEQVVVAGEVTPVLRERLLDRFRAAAATGCDVILSQCSSVGDVADEAARQLDVPIVRIDLPMAEQACRTGRRIGVLATLATSVEPTRHLLFATAERLDCEIEVETRVVDGAFERLEAGDREGHDDRVLAVAQELLEQVDCLVLAQGTMAAILPRLGATDTPVLTSPRAGVERAVKRAREAVAARALETS